MATAYLFNVDRSLLFSHKNLKFHSEKYWKTNGIWMLGFHLYMFYMQVMKGCL